MAYQFVHLQGYSRKGDGKGRNTAFIFGEAMRHPEASLHVEKPLPPVIVYGLDISAVEVAHNAAAADARTTPMGGKERKVRLDQHTLMTVVASHPYTMDEIRETPQKRVEAELWERLTIEWLRRQYGDALASVLRHEDESRWHIHAYILPQDREMKASLLHPGLTAKASIMAAGLDQNEDAKILNRRGDRAYKAAMRAWQDSYFESVAVRCGLARIGPGLRRLSRQEWHREKVQATALQKTIIRAERVKAEAKDFILSTKADVARMVATAQTTKVEAEDRLAKAKNAAAAAVVAHDRAMREQRKALSMMDRARREVDRLHRLPSILRSFWDGFRTSAVQKRIRATVASEVEKLRSTAIDAADRASRSEKARRAAESHATNLRRSLADIGRQRDDAWQELAVLRTPDNASSKSTPRRASP